MSNLELGAWNAICDVCGFKFKSYKLRKRWDGKMVCGDDWETRHPQDLIKIPKDDQSIPWSRPEPADQFVDPLDTHQDAAMFLTLNSGNYASTPDSVANSITGDIDIRVKINPQSLPSTGFRIVSKRLANASNYSYDFFISSNSALTFGWTEDGATEKQILSVALPTVANSILWIRVTLDVDNGVGGYSGRFYTSTDGNTWTQLGTTLIGGAPTSIFNSITDVWLGELQFVARQFLGYYYYAEIRNGIDGTIVNKFDPSNDAVYGNTTWTSSTGEVWTLHGSATLVFNSVVPTGTFTNTL